MGYGLYKSVVDVTHMTIISMPLHFSARNIENAMMSLGMRLRFSYNNIIVVQRWICLTTMLILSVYVCRSIDDIEDNSKLRRGIPVAHSIYGVAQTINSANYIYFLALERITAMGHPRGVAIFTSMISLSIGNSLVGMRETV